MSNFAVYFFVLNCSRGWNKQGGGIFQNSHKLGGHNKLTLAEDRKSTLKMGDEGGGGGVKTKWRGRYLFVTHPPP